MKIIYITLNPRAVSAVCSAHQISSTHILLRYLLRAPEPYAKHVMKISANAILGTTYGYEVQESHYLRGFR